MTPAPIAVKVQCQAAPMTAPEKPPMMIRAVNDGTAVRAGVLGSLSVITSPTARTVKAITAMMLAIQDAQVAFRLIHPRKAAHATTAGAVSERNPATTPINRASSRTSACVTETLLRERTAGHDKGGRPAPAARAPPPRRTLTHPPRHALVGIRWDSVRTGRTGCQKPESLWRRWRRARP